VEDWRLIDMILTDEKTKHIMVDIETWGLAASSVICSIGAVCFNIRDGIKSEFYVENLSIEDQLGLFKRTIDADTVRWWMKQSPEARKCFEKDEFYGAGLLGFHTWIKEAIGDGRFFNVEKDAVENYPYFMWSKSSFDFNILEDAIRSYLLDIPWSYKALMDLRTLSRLIPCELKFEGTKHNALDDAKNQALQTIDILRRFQQTCDLATTFSVTHGGFVMDEIDIGTITVSK
jgi:hypothetical protein